MSDKMTFKPSEDVVEDMQNPIQNEWMVQSFSVWSENLWETVFHSAVSDENTDNASINTDNMVTNTDNEMIANLSNVEIVPSTVPDLSDLLKDDIVTESSDDIQKNSENAGEDVSASDNQESSFVFKSSDDENQNVTTETNSESSDEWDWTNKITDSDREKQRKQEKRQDGQKRQENQKKVETYFKDITTTAQNTLGVKADASIEEIKSAYRKLAKKMHPDALPANATSEQIEEANENFRVITEAYKFLLQKQPELVTTNKNS